jgi:hypothetical protein
LATIRFSCVRPSATCSGPGKEQRIKEGSSY